MKPHIYRRYGIWCCRVISDWVMGHGYTPREAYLDWRAQQ
jgi:hypothetical protein